MLPAFVIVFREVIEAGLVVGVVMAATRGLAGRGLWISGGVVTGVVGACVVALFAGSIAGLFRGAGQETLNASILLVAVAMLLWHNAWMASHGRQMAQNLKEMGAEVMAGRKSLAALAIVCAVAVLREGSEVVLFLYGVSVGEGLGAGSIIAGGALGILGGAAIAAVIYLGLIAIPLKHLFATLSALITLLAAGLAAQAVRLLEQGGWLATWTMPVWDTSAVLSEQGLLGRILHVLAGYSAQPSGAELCAYLAVIAAMILVQQIISPKPAAEPKGRQTA